MEDVQSMWVHCRKPCYHGNAASHSEHTHLSDVTFKAESIFQDRLIHLGSLSFSSRFTSNLKAAKFGLPQVG